MTPLQPSAMHAIGATPLVALDRLAAAEGVKGRLLAKLEFLNPGLSKKDRAARRILEDALGSGELLPGQPVVELTSGNMGTGLAIACAVLGHPFIAVMSRGNSLERARMMRAMGAEVVLVDQAQDSIQGQVSGEDLALVESHSQRLAIERGAWRADQFTREGSWRAHFDGTAPEIWEQSGGAVTVFCDFVGSGGTLGGCARWFKAKDTRIRCYAVEPQGAAALAGQTVSAPGHPIQGGGYGYARLALIDPATIDGYLTVRGEEAVACARRLARLEGLFAGYSSGANVAAALQLLRGPEAGAVVAFTLCDSGLKYLSTDLWEA